MFLASDFITFSFRGKLVQFNKSLLQKLPNESPLWIYLEENYKVSRTEIHGEDIQSVIHINRNGYFFHSILDHLEGRELHFSHCMCLNVIREELKFWGISECHLAPCCLDRLFVEYEERKKSEETQKAWLEISQREKLAHIVDFECNKDTVGHILNNPNSCVAGKILAAVMAVVIITSSLLLSVETEPSVREPTLEHIIATTNLTKGQGLYSYYFNHSFPKLSVLILDLVLTVFLTVEFITRLVLSRDKILFLKQPMSIIDILGIVPVWILLIIYIHMNCFNKQSTTALKFGYHIALLRILRIFRFGHITLHNKKLRIVAVAIKQSSQEIVVLCNLVLVQTLLFGLVMYYVELWNSDTFLTVFEAQWWAVITMATVGYGDYYPKSGFGRFVGVMCCLCGIVIVAMSTSVFVNNFIKIYKCVEKLDRMERMVQFRKDNNRKGEVVMDTTLAPN